MMLIFDGSYYEHRLLEHLDYLLDIGADSTFPSSQLNVSYSYRRTNSVHSQYIHRSGTALVSILHEADPSTVIDVGSARRRTKFAYVPNRIYICHSTREKSRETEVGRALKRICEDRDELTRLWESFRPAIKEGDVDMK
jgi:hypothetical protein